MRAPAVARTPAFKTSIGAVRIACQSGATLESTLASTAIASANARTFQSIAISSARGTKSDPMEITSRTSQMLAIAPATVPASETRTAFREILERELPLRYSERDACRRFAGTRHGAREQQSCDVGARDQQQEAGGRE